MTDTTTQTPQTQGSTGAEMDAVDEQLAAHLVEQARSEGISLVGPDGLLQRLTKLVLEGALEGELTDHLGYEHGDPVGRNGGNSRNGTRAKTVLTEVGPVDLDVPRDRDASFQPKIVRKRQRRLTGMDSSGHLAGRQGPDHRRGASAPGRGLRQRGLPPDHLHDHRPGA